MYDTKLVSAAQQGDEAAFAALYDRNADSVYDLCWALTGDAEEASRLVAEVFRLAARHLEQITEASQMRPWLLAIARDRVLAEDEDGTLHPAWGLERRAEPVADEPLGGTELRRWTRSAAATLALADQVVAELATRHQLDDEQLAAAVGCDVGQVGRIVQQVDQEAEQVLGALVVARQGRRDCADLAAMLEGWDGTPAVDIAEAVDRHAAGCERCGLRRSVASPLDLLAAAPAAAPPADLRNRVLDVAVAELPGSAGPARADEATAAMPATAFVGPPSGAGGTGAAASSATAAAASSGAAGAAAAGVASSSAGTSRACIAPGRPGGAPPTTRSPTLPEPALPRDRPSWGLIAAIAGALVVLAVVLVLVVRSPGHTKVTSNRGSSALAPGTTVAAAPAAPTGTIVPTDATTTPTTPPAGSALELNTTEVNLGSQATAAQVVLTDAGAAPASWRASWGVSWLSIAPSTGYVRAGGSTYVTFRVDRAAAPSGPFDLRVSFLPSDAAGRGTSVRVVGTNASTSPSTTSESPTTVAGSGPTISGVGATPGTISTSPCPDDRTTVTATVTDPSTVTSVVVSFSLPDGHRGTQAMTQSGDVWSASIGGSTAPGTLTFQVSATDAAGLSATSGSHSVAVDRCVIAG